MGKGVSKKAATAGKAKPGGRKLSESEPIRQYHLRRRVGTPLVVKLEGKGRHITIQLGEIKKLNIDDREYQRIQIRPKVTELIHVLRSGGTIPDPISVAEREDGSWWIVDGQQRYWAYSECDLPIPAVIYRVKNIDEEKTLFNIFNDTWKVNADYTVHAWPGQGAETLRKAADTPAHPFYGLVNFGRHYSRPFGAAIVARGMTACLYPGTVTAYTGRIQHILGRLDAAMAQTGAHEKSELYLDAVGRIFGPPTKLKILPAIAFGRVLGRKWDADRAFRLWDRLIVRLRRANWETMVKSHALKYVPVIENEIEKRIG